MRRLAALLALLLFAGACSRRDRLNPLDPSNPDSGGAPTGFQALADYLLVRLQWEPHPELAIDGFALFRLAPGDTDYQRIGPTLDARSSSYFDIGLSNQQDYRYRLHFVIGGEVSPRYAEDLATPGQVRPWAVDAGGGRLLRLTPDARHVLFAISGLGSLASLAVTPNSGAVWAVDDLNAVVHVIDPRTLRGPEIRGIPAPFEVALDPVSGDGWISDFAGSVRHYSAAGLPVPPNGLDLLLNPTGVATDPRNGDVWVCENGGSRLRHYARDGTPLAARRLIEPSRAAVDSLTGEVWVTSVTSGWVWHLSPSLTVLDSSRFNAPLGVALDWRRRTAWVADAGAGRLVGLDMTDGHEKVRTGLMGEPRDVAVDLVRGEPWVAARTEGRVYRFSATGVLVAAVAGLGNVYEVGLDPGDQ